MNLVPIEELLNEDGTLQTWTSAGGYAVTFLDKYDNVTCDTCARDAVAEVNEDLAAEDLIGGYVYWEGPAVTCEHCITIIESEYGDPEEEDGEE